MKPERQTEQQKCLSKLTWDSLEQARAAAAYADWQYGNFGSRPKPYQCRICNKWHLAHA